MPVSSSASIAVRGTFACVPVFSPLRSVFPEMKERNALMLYWALVFLLISLVAALFGFSGIAAVFGGFAQLLFYIFIALFLVTLILHLVLGRGPPPVA
jgi:uncharacterized membrane protein YtjA (UPF0391 family)